MDPSERADAIAFCEGIRPRLVGALTLFCGDPQIAGWAILHTYVVKEDLRTLLALSGTPRDGGPAPSDASSPSKARRHVRGCASRQVRERRAEPRALLIWVHRQHVDLTTGGGALDVEDDRDVANGPQLQLRHEYVRPSGWPLAATAFA